MFNTTIHWQQDEPLLIFAPLISKQKVNFTHYLQTYNGKDLWRVRVDGEIKRLEDCGRLEKYKQHTIELVIDRVTNSKENHPRLFEAIELAIKQANGLVRIEHVETKEAQIYSEKFRIRRASIHHHRVNATLFSVQLTHRRLSHLQWPGRHFNI